MNKNKLIELVQQIYGYSKIIGESLKTISNDDLTNLPSNLENDLNSIVYQLKDYKEQIVKNLYGSKLNELAKKKVDTTPAERGPDIVTKDKELNKETTKPVPLTDEQIEKYKIELEKFINQNTNDIASLKDIFDDIFIIFERYSSTESDKIENNIDLKINYVNQLLTLTNNAIGIMKTLKNKNNVCFYLFMYQILTDSTDDDSTFKFNEFLFIIKTFYNSLIAEDFFENNNKVYSEYKIIDYNDYLISLENSINRFANFNDLDNRF
jgi:hypothetical protein